MDILAIVTLVALALALSMVVITARLLSEERRRSEARVAALSAASSEPATESPVRAVAPPHAEPPARAVAPAVAARDDSDSTIVRRPQSPWRSAASDIAPPAPPPRREPVRAPASRGVDDLDLYPSAAADRPVASAPLFGSTAPRPGIRFVTVVMIGALMVGAGVAFLVWSNSRGASVAANAAPPAASAAAPLELVALKHRRDGDRLAISGIIKNPSGARAVKNVTAVVFLFDESGSFLSSGRAPIDFTTLAPGDESPFVVVVSEPGAVARYRVSFRTDDHVVPHIDRRDPAAAGGGAPAVSRALEPAPLAPRVE